MRQPDGVRMRYYSELRPMLKRMRALTRERIVPRLRELVARHTERLDAALPGGHRARSLVQATARKLAREWPASRMQDIAISVGKATSSFQKAQLFGQIKAGLGIDIGAILDRGLTARLQQFAAENVSLIRTVQDRYFSQIEARILAGISAGDRAQDIADDLEERYNVSESNALRIANDQVGKLTGQLNMARQQQLGIGSFVWRTVEDNRVREEHELLDGKPFDWDDPPDEGIPGEPINCRCSAEPDLSALLEEE